MKQNFLEKELLRLCHISRIINYKDSKLFIIFFFFVTSCSLNHNFNSSQFSYDATIYLQTSDLRYTTKILRFRERIVIDFQENHLKNKNSIELFDNGEIHININEQNLDRLIKKSYNYNKTFPVLLNKCFRGQSIKYDDEMLSLKCDEFVNIVINIFNVEIIYINGIISSKLERQKKTTTNVK